MYTTLQRRDEPAIAIDFAPEVAERVAALQAVLWKNTRPQPDDLEIMNEKAIERAGRCLDALAIRDDLDHAARSVRTLARVYAVHEELFEASGNDFPEEVFDETPVIWSEDVQKVVAQMKERGHQTLAETVERLFATDPGPTVRSLHALHTQAMEERKNRNAGPAPG